MAKRPLNRHVSQCRAANQDSRSRCKGHLRLSNNVPQVSSVKSVAHLDHALEIDLAIGYDTLGVDLQDLKTADLVRQRDLDLSVQTSGTEQRRVKCVGPVGSHDDFGLAQVVETVELVQQLHERSLDFSVGAGSFGETTSTDGVDLVHEDDARLVLLGVAEHLSDQPSRLSYVLVYDS